MRMRDFGPDSIFIFGMSHRTAEIDVRERFAIPAGRRPAVRERISSDLDVPRHVLLSTCNRTELYGVRSGAAAELHADLERVIFPGLGGACRPYCFSGWDAVFHLFRVSAGLDSMVLGESEILGQVKVAFEESLESGEVGRPLADLFRQALVVGKRVRTETQLGHGSLSVAATAVKLARKVVGSLDDKRGAIVGAGETGVLTARHLKAGGIASLTVVNRSLDKAEEIARELDGEARPLDELRDALQRADVVIGCIERDEPTVTPAVLKGLGSSTRCFIDISVPRSIDPAIAEQPGVFAFDIDDLASLVETAKSERQAHVERADGIIVAEAQKFLATQAYADMTPLVAELRASFGNAMETAITESADGGEVREASERLTKRLMGIALDVLKRSMRHRFSSDQVRAAYELFVNQDGMQ